MSIDTESWIFGWFRENVKLKDKDIHGNLDSNYFTLGWIDSFQFITLITDIEEQFRISFSNAEFQDRTFSSVSGLIRIIQRKIHDKK